jgi:hypothetical protein
MTASMFSTYQEKNLEKAKTHESEILCSPEYQLELSFLRRTVLDLARTIRACEVVASRWNEFNTNYLLPSYVDDIIEAAMAAQVAIENGLLNTARRELRYMLEVAVNITYVDEIKACESFEDRINHYRGKAVNKSNVDHVFELPLRMLGDQTHSFARSVRSSWVNASNYVHLTKRRVDEKLRLREQGISLGFETTAMLKNVVADVHEVCSIVIVLTFETIGPSFTGDLLVDGLDQNDDWTLHASGNVALVDSYFDYKHERQKELEKHISRRNRRIRFPVR